MCTLLPGKPRRSLLDIPTSERTEEELNREWYKYVKSKTVHGRFCPTPELGMAHDDPGEEAGDADLAPDDRNNALCIGR